GARRTEISSNNLGGYMTFYSTMGTQATLAFDGSGNFGQTMISDSRLKENISPMSKILGKIMQVNPSFFNYQGVDKSNPTFGFLAQEIQQVFPELVREMDNGYLGIDYSKFSILAIQAIKEQQALIETLLERQEQLENRLQALEQ
ncbi:MAG: tail fiber domain-containing protein, partial [Saprospiraceae bacterium]|nr:tail fiber domain-containing protein [Saprospiraceae bacterium]